MSPLAEDPPTLHFRGEPAALDSFVTIQPDEVGSVPRLSLRTLGTFAIPPAVDVGAGVSRLHLSIPRGTPPGTYNGSVELAGRQYPVEVHVEPRAYLLSSPRQLVLSGHAGEQVHVDLALANSGNVPGEIGKTHAFGLYDVHGAERAIGTAFRQAEESGAGRVEHLLQQLAAGHGGLVRVQVTKGAGSIAPGEVRQLQLTLHLSSDLVAGHTYSGVWPLENLRYYARVRATGNGK